LQQTMSKGLWSRPEFRALIALIAASALIGQGQRAGWTRGTTGVLANAAAAAARPGHIAVAESGHLVARIGGMLTRDHGSASENEALSLQVARLRAEVAGLRGVEEENKRLRKMLAFSRTTELDLTAAEVLGGSASPWFQSIIIDVGSANDLRPGMAVATHDGLVGQVFRVQSKTSDVCLLTDPDSSVSVVDTRSGALGILRGTNEKRLRLSYLSPDADVQRGDGLTTSGVGGVFPRGLAAGTVAKLSYDAHTGTALAEVTPSADLENPHEVFVCTGSGGG
jgi:rod shape-determining protein MreC